MEKKYVPAGAFLTCNKGTLPSRLSVTFHAGMTLYGENIATEADKLPMTHLKPMGVCSITKKSCQPVPGCWNPVQNDVSIGGNRPLLEDSKYECAVGGKVSIFFSVAAAQASLPLGPAIASGGALDTGITFMSDYAGIRLPEEYGPPAPPGAAPVNHAVGLTRDRNGQTIEQMEKNAPGGASVGQAQIVYTDKDKDGILDTAEVKVVGAHVGHETEVSAFKTTKESLDVAYAEANITTFDQRGGSSFEAGVRVGAHRTRLEAKITEPGSDGQNPLSDSSIEKRLLYAEGKAAGLLGRAGGKTGFILRAEAEAGVMDVKAETVTTIPLPFGMDMTIKSEANKTWSPATKLGAGGWIYHNSETDRLHFGVMGKVKVLMGVDKDIDVSIGMRPKPALPAAP